MGTASTASARRTTSRLATRVTALGHFGSFASAVMLRFVAPPLLVPETIRHADTLWRRCLAPVLITILPFGAVIGLQGMQVFDLFGAHRLLSGLLSLVIIRELAPVLAAVLIVAQGGASFAAELGAMRIKEELDATEVMAIDPLRYHVAPRVAAMTLVTPLLTSLAVLSGMAGGYLVATLSYGQSKGVFLENVSAMSQPNDVLSSVVKGLVLGLLMGLLSCYQGYYTTGGSEGVGRAVNRTVVQGVLTILGANWVLSLWLFSGSF